MQDAVRAIPDHLRDALWRIESARAPTMEAPAAFVCGMGGSAIGGDLAVAALSDRLTKPMLTARGYELPSWAPAGSAVLCSSYSGNTEETLGCYAAAEALGAQRLVATTGGELAELARADGVPVIGLPAGLQPRAAVGYMFCVAAELAALALAGPRIHTEIDAAASHLGASLRGDRGSCPRAGRRDRRRHPGHLRQPPDRPGRVSLGDADQRERQDPRLLGDPAGGRPQRARGLVGRGGPLRRDFPRGPRPAPAGAQALRAHREGDQALRRLRHGRRDGGREPHRACAPHGDARRPARDRAGRMPAASTRSRSACSRGSRRRWAAPTGASASRSSSCTITASPFSLPIAFRTPALTGNLCVPSPIAMNELRKSCPSIFPRILTKPRVPKNSAESGITT